MALLLSEEDFPESPLLPEPPSCPSSPSRALASPFLTSTPLFFTSHHPARFQTLVPMFLFPNPPGGAQFPFLAGDASLEGEPSGDSPRAPSWESDCGKARSLEWPGEGLEEHWGKERGFWGPAISQSRRKRATWGMAFAGPSARDHPSLCVAWTRAAHGDMRPVKALSLGLSVTESAMVLSEEGGSNLEPFPMPPT